ncbi:MAG TPA: hypothetical protein VLO31_02040 [Cryobacterium sp.]|nr:hypothetical protein [Cryobacterium sp.]
MAVLALVEVTDVGIALIITVSVVLSLRATHGQGRRAIQAGPAGSFREATPPRREREPPITEPQTEPITEPQTEPQTGPKDAPGKPWTGPGTSGASGWGGATTTASSGTDRSGIRRTRRTASTR